MKQRWYSSLWHILLQQNHTNLRSRFAQTSYDKRHVSYVTESWHCRVKETFNSDYH
jgi:hypothetical protein